MNHHLECPEHLSWPLYHLDCHSWRQYESGVRKVQGKSQCRLWDGDREMSQITAVLGQGAMGSRIAKNLLAARFKVRVWNRTREASTPLEALGARVADSPAAAADSSDFVMSIVRDDEASRAVWLDPDRGALAALRPDAVAIESSTLSMQHAKVLFEAFDAKGIRLLDAPVVGSRPQAEGKQLTYLVGGNPADFQKTLPVFEASSGNILHLGPNGSGFATKLIVNALYGIQVAALAEVLGLARHLELAEATLANALASTPVLSPAAKGALLSMTSRSFAPNFPVELVAKDLTYAAGAERNPARSLPVTSTVLSVLKAAVEAGLGPKNLTAVCELYES